MNEMGGVVTGRSALMKELTLLIFALGTLCVRLLEVLLTAYLCHLLFSPCPHCQLPKT